MRVEIAVVCAAVFGACDSIAPLEPYSPYAPDPEVEVGQFRFGTVTWHDVQTDCVDDAWTYEEAVTVLVEGDQVTLWFDTMPELNGTLSDDGRANVAGTMQFAGDTGALVSCVVNGNVRVSDRAIDGDLQEQLSSTGDVNCVSRGHYMVRLDE